MHFHEISLRYYFPCRSFNNLHTQNFKFFLEFWLGQWRYCTIFIWQFYCQLGRKRLEKGGVGNIHHNTHYCPHHFYHNITGPCPYSQSGQTLISMLLGNKSNQTLTVSVLCSRFRLSKRVWNGISMYSEVWHTAQWWYNTNFPLEQFDWHALRNNANSSQEECWVLPESSS